MHAHYLQHVPFEGLGSIRQQLGEKHCTISGTRFFESAALPAADDLDLLIVMGGPMSVNDEREHPWLVREKAFIRDCIQAGKSVLGVCLGAQLIADAMGARVYRNPEKEIGWFPIRAVESAKENTFRFPSEIEAFHWHGETFDLPPGATLLASSEACKNQAFQIGNSVIGLQFHLETTTASAEKIVSNCRVELVPAPHVQSAEAILSVDAENYRSINRLMAKLLTFLTGN